MKPILLVCLLVFAKPSYSEVFKCEGVNGKTAYQNTPCPKSKQQKKIIIEYTDPDQIIKAQKKLIQDLKQKYELDLIKKELVQKELQIEALRAQTKSNAGIANAIQNHADALSTNKNNRRNSNSFYYPYYRPTIPYGHKQRRHHFRNGNRHYKPAPTSAFNPPIRR